jgi:hypothetical protein
MAVKLQIKYCFLLATIIGLLFWVAFSLLGVEPWDSIYGVLISFLLGAILGFGGKIKPWLWPIGMFCGEALAGIGIEITNILFNRGGGVDLFIPIGILFLVPFAIPAIFGSFVGFCIGRIKAYARLKYRP